MTYKSSLKYLLLCSNSQNLQKNDILLERLIYDEFALDTVSLMKGEYDVLKSDTELNRFPIVFSLLKKLGKKSEKLLSSSLNRDANTLRNNKSWLEVFKLSDEIITILGWDDYMKEHSIIELTL